LKIINRNCFSVKQQIAAYSQFLEIEKPEHKKGAGRDKRYHLFNSQFFKEFP